MTKSTNNDPEKITSGSTLKDGLFDGVDFSHADLSDCTFEQCSFVGTNFRASNLNNTEFTRCEFNEDSSDTPADFSQASLREAIFRHCNLTVVEFVRCRAYGISFEHCQMQGCNLTNGDFRLPVGDSDLAEFNMISCNFSYGNLSNTYLADANFSESRMLEACLDYCDLTRADLSGTTLHNLSAIGLTLKSADLRGAEFNNINPRDIDLEGVRLYFSQIQDLLGPLGIELEADPK